MKGQHLINKKATANKMKNLTFSILFLLQNYLFIVYLFFNIKNFDEMGGASSYIFLFYIVSFLIMIISSLKKNIYITKSSLILILIVLWVSAKILIDVGDLAFLKQSIFATTGGILFFFLSGFSLSVSYLEIINRYLTQIKIKNILLIVFFFIAYSNLDLFFTLKSKLRNDIFLIEGLNGNYQRAGNFLSILFLLTSYIYVLLKISFVTKSKKMNFGLILTFVYITILFIVSVSAQMMGSNNAFIVVLGSGMITLIFIGVTSSKRYIKKNECLSRSICDKGIIKIFFYKSIIYIFILIFLTFLILLIFDFDINSTRFVGYGAKTNTSLDSRLLILSKNFIIHFEDSPIIGNFNIDQETTGVGTYIHSFFLYALTHTGIIGFVGFIVFFFYIFSLLLNRHISVLYYNCPPYPYEKSIRFYFLCLLCFLLLIANVGTTITWAVLWFAVGYMGQIFMIKGFIK